MGKIQLATPPATTPAKSVVMAVLGASNRSIDSITNNEEANGAAKAAANRLLRKQLTCTCHCRSILRGSNFRYWPHG